MAGIVQPEEKLGSNSALSRFEHCPLIEIVHFHECLRGELRALSRNVHELMRQAVSMGRHAGAGPGEAAGAAGGGEGGGDGMPQTGDWPLPEEHINLELQMKSQFKLLWAAFQAHSTAEDEIIWPALNEKAKTRTTADKGKKRPLPGNSKQGAKPPQPQPSPPQTLIGSAEGGGKERVERRGRVVQGSDTATRSEAKESIPNRDEGASAAATAAAADRVAGEEGGDTRNEDNSGGDGGDDGEGEEGAGEGMADTMSIDQVPIDELVDEAEYAEDHSQEQKLFEGMSALLEDLRFNRMNQHLEHRRQLLAKLAGMTQDTCRHLLVHLEKEETGALPLIERFFSAEEMAALVGRIMGTRPSELMQAILGMMVKNLPPEEVGHMLGHMRTAVKDTYFEKWLDSGEFQWPGAPSEGEGAGRSGTTSSKATGRKRPLTGGQQQSEGEGGACSIMRDFGSLRLLEGRETRIATAAPGAAPAVPVGTVEGGGVEGGGTSTSVASAPPSSAAAAVAAPAKNGAGQTKAETKETKAEDATRERAENLAAVAAAVAVGAVVRVGACAVCAYVGRCPATTPLSEKEFTETVKRIGRERTLDGPKKSALVQALRTEMFQGSKRARTDQDEQQKQQKPHEEQKDISSGGGQAPPLSALHSELEGEDISVRAGGAMLSSRGTGRGGLDGVSAPGGEGEEIQGPGGAAECLGSAQGQATRSGEGEVRGAGDAWRTESANGLPVGQARGRGGGGAKKEKLLAPKRWYRKQQADVEDSAAHNPADDACFTAAELAPTYRTIVALSGRSGADAAAGEDEQQQQGEMVLGCPHYQRACKLRAACCGKLFTCRLCHDEVMEHTMDRYAVQEMLCMRCGTMQPVDKSCSNPACGTEERSISSSSSSSSPSPTTTSTIPASASASCSHSASVLGSSLPSGVSSQENRQLARYYCSICKLFDDAPGKDIYHCPYCNVCRVGKGLGIDFWHCMKCNACISMGTDTHPCVNQALGGNCPICHELMFTSTSQVKGLRCGHMMHLQCYKEYIQRDAGQTFPYRCPICLKSMEDLREYFSQLDRAVAAQPMPAEYKDVKAKVQCHDCEKTSIVPFHFLYHRCGECGSYNTRVESQIRPNTD